MDITQNIGDIKFLFQFSNAPQQSAMMVSSQDETGTNFDKFVPDITVQVNISSMIDDERYGLRFKGSFSANATTGGTVDFQWAQNTSSANFTTLFFSSWMSIKQLD